MHDNPASQTVYTPASQMTAPEVLVLEGGRVVNAVMKKRGYRKQANQLTVIQAAYLAGFIDGEGCITATLRRGSIDCRLEVGSTNRALLERIKKETGVGCICTKKKRSKNARRLHLWNVSTRSLSSLLTQVLPHLRLKKQQAEIMLALVAYEYPSRVVETRQVELVDTFRVINRRGETVLQA